MSSPELIFFLFRKVDFVHRSKTYQNDVKKFPKTNKDPFDPNSFFRRIPELFLERTNSIYSAWPILGGYSHSKSCCDEHSCPDPNFKFLRNPEIAHESPAFVRPLSRWNCRTRVFWWYIRDLRTNITLDWSLQRLNQHVERMPWEGIFQCNPSIIPSCPRFLA